ncbi:site-specific integrase [Gloeocapsa sp. PCC 7428]|uniref:tyrosine-type recombinase/integrase n=1 Tax=Cyanophyceae TaxID=3028117 RepID=UPI0002A66C55|nr:integrase family protein [Gloeocapsa sp. PCC 7428]PPS42076.1 integrase [Chroococcidiopsis sp. TS-821]
MSETDRLAASNKQLERTKNKGEKQSEPQQRKSPHRGRRSLTSGGVKSLKLFAPVPSTLHPASVYLASLSQGSRATMRRSLNAIASLLTDGECDALTLDWSNLSYQHTAAVRAILVERFAPATAKKMVAALRRVLKEAARLGLMSYEDYARATDLPRIDTPPQKLRGRALANKEIATLLDECDEANTIAIRDAAILAILRGGGIRRQELTRLKLQDYNSSTGELEICSAKRKSYRTVYLPAAAVKLVEAWLEIRGRKRGALICPVRKGGQVELRHMSGDAVLKIVKKLSVRAGVEEFSPHDFRRTFCSDLLDGGIDVFTVQKLAGHSSPLTTSKYDRRGDQTKRQAVERLFFPQPEPDG